MASTSSIWVSLSCLGMAPRRGVFRQGTNLPGAHSADFDALRAAAFAGNDSNSRGGYLQTRGEKAAKGIVRTPLDRWGGQTHLQRALPFAVNRIAARPRHYAHGESRGTAFTGNLDHAARPRLWLSSLRASFPGGPPRGSARP